MTEVNGLKKGAHRIIFEPAPKGHVIRGETFSRKKRTVRFLAQGLDRYGSQAERDKNLYTKREMRDQVIDVAGVTLANAFLKGAGIALKGKNKTKPLSYAQYTQVSQDVAAYKTALPVKKFIKGGGFNRQLDTHPGLKAQLTPKDRENLADLLYEEVGRSYLNGVHLLPGTNKETMLAWDAEKVITKFEGEMKKAGRSGHQIIEKPEAGTQDNKRRTDNNRRVLSDAHPVQRSTRAAPVSQPAVVSNSAARETAARETLANILQDSWDRASAGTKQLPSDELSGYLDRIKAGKPVDVDLILGTLMLHLDNDHEYQVLEAALSNYARVHRHL